MSAGCGHHHGSFEGLSADYKRRLWTVIIINRAYVRGGNDGVGI